MLFTWLLNVLLEPDQMLFLHSDHNAEFYKILRYPTVEKLLSYLLLVFIKYEMFFICMEKVNIRQTNQKNNVENFK